MTPYRVFVKGSPAVMVEGDHIGPVAEGTIAIQDEHGKNIALFSIAEIVVKSNAESKYKTRVSQTDVPAYALEQALRIPRAIAENYASAPTPPLRVAKALNSEPGSRPLRMDVERQLHTD
jgi:hypothetical protein